MIYTSSYPSQAVHSHSILTHILSSTRKNHIGRHPADLIAYIDAVTGTSLSRAQVKSLAFRFGYGLGKIGARRGDTILVYSHNSLAWPVVAFGAIAAGIRCTLANSAYTAQELSYQYQDSGSHFVMTTKDGLPIAKEMFKNIKVPEGEAEKRIIVIGDDLNWATGSGCTANTNTLGFLRMEDLLTYGSLSEEARFDGDDAHETILLCYSSGTTGKPKGVETTHQNLTTVIDIAEKGFTPIRPGEDAFLCILPFYHIYGFTLCLLYTFLTGLPTVIQQRFEPKQFCANIEKYKITYSFVVPPVLVVLSRHDAVDEYDLSSLKVLLSSAAPVGPSLVQSVRSRIARRWKNKVLAITQGYGLTETSPTTHLLPMEDQDRKLGSVGLLVPNLRTRIIAEEEGDRVIDAEVGQPGELWISGPTVMKGYLNNPSATKNAITPDGWFKTGDIAIRDKDGYYYIVDRRKELIKYNGFQVPPAELESVLLTHPDIADAAVIGVENVEEATELPRAYVVHADSTKVSTEAARVEFGKSVARWIEPKVARHKYLRGGVAVIDVIPRSGAGKILRRELRERAKTELANVRAKL